MSDHVNDGEDGSGHVVRWFITGERDWTDREPIRRIILELLNDVEGYGGLELVIVHGDCPTGADYIAECICVELGIRTERFPVLPCDGPWPGAGPRRNRRAIDSGALAGWIAFWSGKRDKSGTLDAFAYGTSRGVSGQVVSRLDPIRRGRRGSSAPWRTKIDPMSGAKELIRKQQEANDAAFLEALRSLPIPDKTR